MKVTFLLASSLAVLLAPAAARATNIVIDGKFADWDNVTQFVDGVDAAQKDDVAGVAITDNLGANGKADATDTLYIGVGMYAIAAALGAAALLRLLLAPGDAGLLVVRSRLVDVVALGILGAAVAVVASVTPFPPPAG